MGFAGFIGYAIWCEAVRGVDAGIGDFAQVPLGSGYKLQMIDTPQNAFIRTPGGDEIEIGSRPFGFDDKFIYVETNPGRFSLIDKAAGHALGELDAPDLDRKLHQVGVKKGAIRSAWATYTDLRWSVVDLLAAIAILVLPVLVGVTVLLYVFRVRRMIGNGA